MWEYHTDEKRGWKYTVTSNKFVIQMTGGSIAILDRQTKIVLKKHKGHHYLYTGDISPDETQCFGLENGKHFYVYSLENYELMKRVTLPRGYDCSDMYGHYSSDGKQICIPASRWVGGYEIDSGARHEFVLCRYDASQFTLLEKTVIEDPKDYRWPIDDTPPTLNEEEQKAFQKVLNMVSDNLDNKKFLDRVLGIEPLSDDPAVEALMELIFGHKDTE